MDNVSDIEKDYLDNYAEEVYSIISKNVQKYRKLTNMSQLELALAIGLKGAAYLGKAELRKDNQHFNIKHLAKISKILNIDICEFFKE